VPLADSAIRTMGGQTACSRSIFSDVNRRSGRGTVNGMVPDLRFVLGAVLALAVLAVAGLGLATSVQLMQEAQLNPVEDARSLAFAGHPEWNQFYDPAGARRFAGLADNTDGPVAQERPEAAAEAAPIAPPEIVETDPPERTASIPGHGPEADLAPVVAPVATEDQVPEKAPMAEPARTDSPPAAPSEVKPPALVAEPAGGPTPGASVAPDSGAPPAEQVASAPAAAPGPPLPRDPPEEPQAETRLETPTPAQKPASALPQATAESPPELSPPTPRARPKVRFHRKVARARPRGVIPPTPQPLQNSGWPPAAAPSSSWPGYDNQFTGATAKKTATPARTLAAHPQ
jgi:hypothetical protein